MAKANTYDDGETVTLKGSSFDELGAPANADTVTLYIERPDGTVETKTAPAVTNPGTGLYEYDDIAIGRGRTWYRYKFQTGSRISISRGYYIVREERPAA